MKMLKYYISFWLEWKEVLLDGKLTAKNPESYYSQACSASEDRAVITVYSDRIVEIDKPETVVVNASGEKSLIVKNAAGKKYRIVNCMGEELKAGEITMSMEEIAVPMSGMIFVE